MLFIKQISTPADHVLAKRGEFAQAWSLVTAALGKIAIRNHFMQVSVTTTLTSRLSQITLAVGK